MPDTGVIGPLANTAVGTGLGDGTNYGAFSNTARLHRTATGASAATVTAANKGTRWYNCFDSNQIPSGATITGVEIVATTDFDGAGDSNMGTFGTTGAAETITFKAFLYNGSEYSDALAFDGQSRTGFTYANNDTEATLTGPNRRYLGMSTLGTLFGASDDLSGLTWDPANQADFGFAIVTTAVTDTPVAGILRGVGLRVTYSEGTIGEKLNTIISGSVAKLDTVVGNTIAKFNSIIFTGATPPTPSLYSSTLWDFEDQTTQEGASSAWSPTLTHSDWVTGTSAVSTTYWGQPSGTTDTVRGWHLGFGTTTSGNTGPSGGYNGDGSGGHNTSNGRYMYTETSSPNTSGKCFVSRTPGINYSTNMDDTSNNLDLKFWLHAYGSDMGDLYIYIDDATSSNHTNATLLQSYTSFTGFTANDSAWQEQTISLNSYRSLNNTYYIYFIYQNNTSFRGDLCIDNVQFVESS